MAAPKAIVGIIGAAVAGPVLALQILSHPILRTLYRPILYEQQDSCSVFPKKDLDAHSDGLSSILHTAGAAVGIFPNGLFPLYELGLREKLDEISCEMDQIQVWRGGLDGSHRLYNTAANQGWASDLQTCPRGVERRRLQALLISRFEELGGEILWNKKVHLIESLKSGYSKITFTDTESAEVDLLVGADGAWSQVRRYILHQRHEDAAAEKRWIPDFTGIVGLYGISSASISRSRPVKIRDAAPLILLDKGNIGALPLKDGKIAWTMHLPEPTAPDRSTPVAHVNPNVADSSYEHLMVPGVYDTASTAEILHNHEKVYHPTFNNWQHVFESSERIIRSPLRLAVWEKDEIQCGNAVLIGDAARVLPPYSGQGSSFGIEDATVLANALLNHPSNASTGEHRFHSALEEYADRRMPRSKKIATLAAWSGALTVGDRWWWRWLRDVGARMPIIGNPKTATQSKKGSGAWLLGERFTIRLRNEENLIA